MQNKKFVPLKLVVLYNPCSFVMIEAFQEQQQTYSNSCPCKLRRMFSSIINAEIYADDTEVTQFKRNTSIESLTVLLSTIDSFPCAIHNDLDLVFMDHSLDAIFKLFEISKNKGYFEIRKTLSACVLCFTTVLKNNALHETLFGEEAALDYMRILKLTLEFPSLCSHNKIKCNATKAVSNLVQLSNFHDIPQQTIHEIFNEIFQKNLLSKTFKLQWITADCLVQIYSHSPTGCGVGPSLPSNIVNILLGHVLNSANYKVRLSCFKVLILFPDLVQSSLNIKACLKDLSLDSGIENNSKEFIYKNELVQALQQFDAN